jgi:hypothetical protein
MSEATLEVRNLRFSMANVPRWWHGGRRAVSAYFDNLSVFFPAGERFFVESVRANERFAKSESLRREVKAFCGQEGIHSREHVRYNAHLREQGYPIDEMERRVKRLLKVAKSALPPRARLGVTCALEHFTALMAHMILEDPKLLEGADPTMAALWRWHAAEENEHRAVAFDLFRDAGGTYAERAGTMAIATVIFWAKVVEQQARMMNHDGTATTPREWAAVVKFLFVEPGGMQHLIRPYLDYYRPGFHPHDIECTKLVEQWVELYRTSEVYRSAALGLSPIPAGSRRLRARRTFQVRLRAANDDLPPASTKAHPRGRFSGRDAADSPGDISAAERGRVRGLPEPENVLGEPPHDDRQEDEPEDDHDGDDDGHRTAAGHGELRAGGGHLGVVGGCRSGALTRHELRGRGGLRGGLGLGAVRERADHRAAGENDDHAVERHAQRDVDHLVPHRHEHRRQADDAQRAEAQADLAEGHLGRVEGHDDYVGSGTRSILVTGPVSEAPPAST